MLSSRSTRANSSLRNSVYILGDAVPDAGTIEAGEDADLSAVTAPDDEDSLFTKAFKTDIAGQLTLTQQDNINRQQASGSSLDGLDWNNDSVSPQYGEENLFSDEDPLRDLFEED